MEQLSFRHEPPRKAKGTKAMSLVGVVDSSNLEVLAERVLPDVECAIEITTAAEGFGEVWAAVVADFVERYSPGGIRFSINDGGAHPDTVFLRLAQAARSLEDDV
jgi:malonate decarboxylase delta subunit